MEHTGVEYAPMMRDFAASDRPRERLLKVGPKAVSTAELLAIIMRTGSNGENVVRLLPPLTLAVEEARIGLSKLETSLAAIRNRT